MNDRRQNHVLRRLLDGYDDATEDEFWEAVDPAPNPEAERELLLARGLAALARWERESSRRTADDLFQASRDLFEANARCSAPWPTGPR